MRRLQDAVIAFRCHTNITHKTVKAAPYSSTRIRRGLAWTGLARFIQFCIGRRLVVTPPTLSTISCECGGRGGPRCAVCEVPGERCHH